MGRDMELVDFLLSRIAEDEERAAFVARQIEGNDWTFEPWKLSWHDEYDLLCVEPSRALAECEAKRRIVELAAEATRFDEQLDDEFRAGPRDMEEEPYLGDQILRALAAPYAAHPDYPKTQKEGGPEGPPSSYR